MIRPFTIACAVFAAGSGLFLYTKKHETTVLDQNITSIVQETQRVRGQTAMLRTEWALLNQPDRLNRLAARFVPDLHPMEPNQFIRLTSLESRLPAPGSKPAPADPRETLHDVVNRAAEAAHLPLPSAALPPAHQDSPQFVAKAERPTPPAKNTASKVVLAKIAPKSASPHMPRVHTPDIQIASASQRPAATVARTRAEHSEPVPSVRFVNYHESRPAPIMVAAWHPQALPHTVHAAAHDTEIHPHTRHASYSSLARADDALPAPVPLAN